MPFEAKQFAAAGGVPHLGRLIPTAGDNPLTVRGKSHRGHVFQVASERLPGQVSLPLPIVPFKTTVRRLLRLFQHLPQPAEVVLFPGLLSQVHLGHVKVAARFGLFYVRPQALLLLGFLGALGVVLRRLGGEPLLRFGIPGPAGLERLPAANDDSDHEGGGNGGSCGEHHLVPTKGLLDPVGRAGRTGGDRFVVEVPLQVGSQTAGSLVTARPVLFQALHHDPVQIAFELVEQLRGVGGSALGRGREFLALQRRQARARADRLLLPNRLAHRVDARRHQLFRIKGSAARQQFVEQHPQAVDVAARVDVQTGHDRLFGAHVSGGADERFKLREEGLVRQPPFGGLRNSKINHLRHGHAVVDGHEDVRRLDVAVDDPFLVRVLDGLANLDEQVEPIARGKPGFVTILRDLDAAHQFHDEVGPAGVGCAAIEHLGDVGMIHHGQCLALGFEAGNDRLRVHPQFDDLEGDPPAHRFLLLGHIDHAHAAFADLLEELVAANDGTRAFVRPGVQQDGLGLPPTLARFQEVNFSRVVKGREQLVNPSAQVPILATGAEKIPFPRLG